MYRSSGLKDPKTGRYRLSRGSVVGWCRRCSTTNGATTELWAPNSSTNNEWTITGV